jgi:hypothetical protein
VALGFELRACAFDQALHHLRAFVLHSSGVLFAQAGLRPCTAGITDACFVEMGSHLIFAWAGLEL